jgi:hypothetical protein
MSAPLILLTLVHEDGMSNSYAIALSDIPDLVAFEKEVRTQQHQRQYIEEEDGTLLDVIARKALLSPERGQQILRVPEGYYVTAHYTAWTWS